MATCTWKVAKAYLESLYLFACIPASIWRGQMSAISSAFYAKVPFCRNFASIIEFRLPWIPCKAFSFHKTAIFSEILSLGVLKGLILQVQSIVKYLIHDLNAVMVWVAWPSCSAPNWICGFSHSTSGYLTSRN